MDKVLSAFAEEQGIGLINGSPLHMRVLTDRGAPDWHPAPRRVWETGRKVAAFCRDRGINVADLAMQFAMANERVATTLVGMSKVRHVDMNVKSVGKRPDLGALAEVREMIEPVANICWKEGRPENDDPSAVEKQS